ncbi:MAG: hypothetical protein ACRDQ0_15835, partial [Pseudonocardia sp.]
LILRQDVVTPDRPVTLSRIAAMAQPHKGLRTQIKMSMPDAVRELIWRAQGKYQVTEFSQFLADLLCLTYGRPDLARKLGQDNSGQLRLSLSGRETPDHMVVDAPRTDDRGAGDDHGPTSIVKARVPDEVMQLIKADTARLGISSPTQFVLDLFCHVFGRSDLARELHPRREEQLGLSVLPRREPDQMDPHLVA